MVDTVSKKKRSEIMSAVRSKNTKIEIKFRKVLKKAGYKFRKNVSNYFGKPDIVLSKLKAVIFIDSCFWHGCKRHCRLPSSKRKYWVPKIKRNKERDNKVKKYYKKIGWKIIRFWEHDLNDVIDLQKKIKRKLKKD
jgi:DNA mismatch endonuclease (patch repair protein)